VFDIEEYDEGVFFTKLDDGGLAFASSRRAPVGLPGLMMTRALSMMPSLHDFSMATSMEVTEVDHLENSSNP